MKWFKHDANAVLDTKLRKVRAKYGLAGYGLYWYCLECVARNVEKHNLTFELEEDAHIISLDTELSQEVVQEMMLFMCELGLFENVNGIITCLKMADRSDEYTQKLMRSLQGVGIKSGDCRDKIPPNRREEKRIEQNNTRAKPKRFVPPSVDEVAEYCRERKNGINPQEFVAHYQANGWMRGKSKVKDWKACVRTWEASRKPSQKQRAVF